MNPKISGDEVNPIGEASSSTNNTPRKSLKDRRKKSMLNKFDQLSKEDL